MRARFAALESSSSLLDPEPSSAGAGPGAGAGAGAGFREPFGAGSQVWAGPEATPRVPPDVRDFSSPSSPIRARRTEVASFSASSRPASVPPSPPPPAPGRHDAAASACPRFAAASAGDSPFSSLAAGSAPCRANTPITSTRPLLAAACSGVAPSAFSALASAPASSNSHRAASVSPRAAAQCNAVCPTPGGR